MKSSIHFFKFALTVSFIFLYINHTANSSNSYKKGFPVTLGGIQTTDYKNGRLTLFWNKASDDDTIEKDLRYKVFYSRSNEMNTVEEVLKNGTSLTEWKKDFTTVEVKNLQKNRTYHYNVLVKDAQGNTSSYSRSFAYFGTPKKLLVAKKEEEAFDGVVHEVKMLNVGSDGAKMVFEPEVVYIKPGEAVKFIPVDKGHNVMQMTEDGTSPEGTEMWEGKLNKVYLKVFKNEGIYGVKCKPHYAMGMIGGVVVGKPVNLSSLESATLKGKVAARMSKIVKKVKKDLSL